MDYKNFDWSKVMWKPLWNNASYNGTGLVFNLNGSDAGNHPMVILEAGDSVLYLGTRSARWQNLFEKNKLSSEYADFLWTSDRAILIDKTEAFNPYGNKAGYKSPLFYNDSLVDVSTVFIMKKEEFLERFKVNEESLYCTRSIDQIDKVKILNSLLDNMTTLNAKGELQMSIIEVTINKETGCVEPHNLVVDIERWKFDNKENLEFLDAELQNIKKENKIHQNYLDTVLGVVNEQLSKEKMKLDKLEWDFHDLQYYEAVMEPRLSNVRDDEDIDIDLSKDGYDWWQEDLKIKCQQLALSDYEKDYYEAHPDEFEENFKTNYDKFQDYMREHKRDYEYTR